MFLEDNRLLLEKMEKMAANGKKSLFFCFDCDVLSHLEKAVLIYMTFVSNKLVPTQISLCRRV